MTTVHAGTLSTNPSHIRIEIGRTDSRPYKSIQHLIWDGIPPFTVLTGLNGSGKSQLLELLAYKLTNTHDPQTNQPVATQISVTGATFGTDDVAYLPTAGSFSGNLSVGLAQMQQAKRQLFDELREHNIRNNIRRRAMKARLEKLLATPNLDNFGVDNFIKQLPDDYTFMLENEDVIAGLGHVFIAYRLKFAEELEQGRSRADTVATLGPAPWDVLNDSLRVADFPYRLVSPLKTKLAEVYTLQLEDQLTGHPRSPGDLSSGEKVILQLVLWLYNSKHHNRFPKLFLLDEPDAHLHPSMTRQFIDVIKEVLVDRYGVRVILATHSPSTVALAPDDSIFEMSRNNPRIRQSPSKGHTIGLLTSGLVTVFSTTRFVFVEDEDDVEFDEAVRIVLMDYGPSRDPRALKPAPSIVFMPASSGKGRTKATGGKSVVSKWIEMLSDPPLDSMFYGIIDLDQGNTPTQRVSVLGRYSFENYLLDPFVLFGLLLEENAEPRIAGAQIAMGDEYVLRALEVPQLQMIVDAIRSKMEPVLTGLTSPLRWPVKIRRRIARIND